MPDDQQIPARMIQAAMVDPAGGSDAAINFGQEVVPHIHTASGRYGIASRAYLNMDEALRDSRTNAQRMRSDCGIMECLEMRQRAVALLPWHVEPADPKNAEQVELASQMTAILEETPRFTEMRRSLLEAIWFGRYAVANVYGPERVNGKWRNVVSRWEPRHGDKLVFRFDDGTHTTDPDQMGIRVSSAFRNSLYHKNPITGNIRHKVQATEMGLVYWLDRHERDTMIVHKHMVEDGPWEDPRSSGRIHGIGIRDRIYWTWYAMIECLQRVVEYLDRAAFGIEVWPYPAHNAKAKQATEEAAFEVMSGGRTVIMAPIPAGEDGSQYMPQIIEPGLGGVNTTIEVIQSFFAHKIKRYILGQTLTSEADATGLGSGVADAHLATFADIVEYDARNLQETLTKDLVRVLQLRNFPGSYDCKLKFRVDTEAPNVKERLDAVRSAWDMGTKINAEDVYSLIGVSRPGNDDEVLQNPQIASAGMAGAGAGLVSHPSGGAVISPEVFQQAFVQSVSESLSRAA